MNKKFLSLALFLSTFMALQINAYAIEGSKGRVKPALVKVHKTKNTQVTSDVSAALKNDYLQSDGHLKNDVAKVIYGNFAKIDPAYWEGFQKTLDHTKTQLKQIKQSEKFPSLSETIKASMDFTIIELDKLSAAIKNTIATRERIIEAITAVSQEVDVLKKEAQAASLDENSEKNLLIDVQNLMKVFRPIVDARAEASLVRVDVEKFSPKAIKRVAGKKRKNKALDTAYVTLRSEIPVAISYIREVITHAGSLNKLILAAIEDGKVNEDKLKKRKRKNAKGRAQEDSVENDKSVLNLANTQSAHENSEHAEVNISETSKNYFEYIAKISDPLDLFKYISEIVQKLKDVNSSELKKMLEELTYWNQSFEKLYRSGEADSNVRVALVNVLVQKYNFMVLSFKNEEVKQISAEQLKKLTESATKFLPSEIVQKSVKKSKNKKKGFKRTNTKKRSRGKSKKKR